MKMPILKNHNPNEVIGKITPRGNHFEVEFDGAVSITKEMFFDIFSCGAEIVESYEYNHDTIITKAKILEFSYLDEQHRLK